jgi:hypothetical protein
MVFNMKAFVFTLFLFSPILTYGQLLKPADEQVNEGGASKLVFADSLTQAIELANEDIIKGTRLLLLKDGIAPVVYASDAKFEEDYKIFYHESGCTGPREQIAIEYNKVMFKYLTQTYGKKWVKTARKDILGLKSYKQSIQNG